MDHTLHVFRGSGDGKIIQDEIKRTLGSNDVLLDITHVSICGTDDLFLRSSQVLGHEGVGVVREKGGGVTSVNIGDRVGAGYIQNVCGECKDCVSGWNQYCANRQRYGASAPEQGCLGKQAVWDAKALISIPQACSSTNAAALMCGGATAWTVLTRYGIRRGQRVGIIGVGGMGHLAVKLSAALGYHTVVFSRSNSKRDDCMSFGSKEFYLIPKHTAAKARPMNDPAGVLPGIFEPVDHLLLCSSVAEDFTMLMKLVATRGTIYPLTVSLDSVPVPLLAMIDNGIGIQGSLTASTESLFKMLQFCASNHVNPLVECHSLDQNGVKTAFQALKEGSVRYKTVLEKAA
ncbi:alcohol dehydrogenase, partial [Penicillium nucicola]|uniref:alcohol dehydrogenase n=1 Tax=Penicillium nucicola TaxID=1850975 RepID=UPI002545ADF8